MSTPSGPFTVRPWLHGANPGGVVVINTPTNTQVLNTTTLAGSTAVAEAILAAANPTPPPPPPPPAVTQPCGGFVVLNGSNATTAGIDFDHVQYGIVQWWRTDLLAELKAGNSTMDVLGYFNANISTDAAPTDGLPAAVAQAAWYATTTAGAHLAIDGFPLEVAVYGIVAYQNAVASYIINFCQTNGLQGVFIDNADTVPSTSGGVYPSQYPTAAAWQGAMGVFLNCVGAQLAAEGLLLVANIGAWNDNPIVGQDWVEHPGVAGAMDEMFFGWPQAGALGKSSAAVCENQLGSLNWCAENDKIYLACCQAAASDVADMEYCLAGVLSEALSTKQAIFFANGQDYDSGSTWPASWTAALSVGAPSGAAVLGTSITREFANGSLTLTPGSTGTIEVTG